MECLEDRRLLAADFLRTGGGTGANADAVAEIRWKDFGGPDEFDAIAQSDTGTEISHASATAVLAIEGAKSLSHTDTTGLTPVPIDVATAIPTVNVASSYNLIASSSEDWTAAASAGLNPLAPVNANANATFELRIDDANQYLFHGTLFIGAYGGTTGSGGGVGAVEAGASASIKLGTFGPVYSLSESVVTPEAFNQYLHFTALIAEGTLVTFQTSTSGKASVVAPAPAATATALFQTAGAAWGYVTPLDEDLPPGDIDGDGDTDDEDLDLWQDNVGDDADGDGDVDQDDFVIWLESAGAIVVTTEIDEDGENPSETSLREAIDMAASNTGPDTIAFAPWVETIVLNNEQLSIVGGNDVSIFGHGVDGLTVDANGGSRVFSIGSGASVTMTGLTITGGLVTGTSDGGGIANWGGNLTLDSVLVTQNQSLDHGGGIYNYNGTLHIIDSTISDNDADVGGGISSRSNAAVSVIIEGSAIIDNDSDSGGGIRFDDLSNTSGHAAKIINSTISGNHSTDDAGGIQSTPLFSMTIINSTITKNTADGIGGGIRNSGGSAKLYNTIVADNTAMESNWRSDWEGTKAHSSSSNNLIGINGSIGLTDGIAGNQVGNTTMPKDPELAALGDYGGPTMTHALEDGSPALDAGSDSVVSTYNLTTDQRGLDRTVDLAGVGSTDEVDIGSFEAGNENTLIVTILDDESDSDLTVDDISLREALELSSLIPGHDTISFDDTLFATSQTIVLSRTLEDLVVASDVTIDGPGKDLLTINANGDSDFAPQRAFATDPNTDVTIRGLTVTGGDVWTHSGSRKGGGIWSRGDLTLEDVSLTGNEAEDGGGLYHQDGTLVLRRTEVLANAATGAAAGVYVDSAEFVEIDSSGIYGNFAQSAANGVGGLLISDSETVIYNTTFYFNVVEDGLAGGIAVVDSDVTLLNVTVADNWSNGAVTGGIFADSLSTVTLHNSIVAENTISGNDADLSGNFDPASSYNLIGFDDILSNGIDDDGGSGNHNMVGGESGAATIDARLTSLADHGGPTLTVALLDDSPAIDAGSNSALSAVETAFALDIDFDQRGEDRIVDWEADDVSDIIDIGAIELAFDEIYS